MSLDLIVDGERWRAHLRTVASSTPGLVPVAKGNGYGLGLGRLARRAEWLGVDTLAVGTYDELPEVASRFPGSLLVLTPWRPWVAPLAPDLQRRVIHTISRPADLGALTARQQAPRVVLERMTSMRRHGLSAAELWDTAPIARRRARIEGVTIHLPMTGGNLAEARRLMDDVVGAEASTVWISHLTLDELRSLQAAYPDITIRPRVGTGLWLGDRGALSVTAKVLDVHPLSRGESYGYRQRHGASGHLVIASGGTAHGIGLAAPSGDAGLRGRAAVAAKGGLETLGVLRSPYVLDGKPLHFAEPPHMQASMLLLPRGTRVPEVGEKLDVRVRYTATTFDSVTVS
ncbi:alanine racemase [Nocardioides sp. CER19]|uniref:alanine racemase n=1 Tax=Nocardioides sp. CER19 TaxID=3038538 RepID=UPI00244A01EA|nr:alanine racemase [Nocardioides sp. CER19]MDH2412820.1 alanine racemase [Nocardioides sp. CER19]